MPPAPSDEFPWKIPNFELRISNLAHPGASVFLDAVKPTQALHDSVVSSLKWLYTPDTAPIHVHSIALILREMDGVAHTTGNERDKEIHFSLQYIHSCQARARDEILGVLTHEVVHCYQYDAQHTCPSGLIEGIADYVRLRAELGPPHWRKTSHGKWDAGYETTGYFLDWLEKRHGEGTIRALNAGLKDTEYNEGIFKKVTGQCVEKLWKRYGVELDGKEVAGQDGEQTCSVV